MKVLPFKIPKPKDDVLIYQEDIGENFYNQLHQHEEIQLSIIIEGEGTLIVGNTVNSYKKGDVLVIGSHLPHVFKSDNSKIKISSMLTLFFTKPAFGTRFFELNELNTLRPFFKRAAQGFKISRRTTKIESLFQSLSSANKLERFITLLNIMKIVSRKQYESLSSFVYDKNYNLADGKKLQVIYDYTMTNFKKDISLDSIADIANMTKSAFCKYFKKRTNKTYFSFLNELRIAHACKLLNEDVDMSISEIAFTSGYHNIANFNRQFKAIKQTTPSEFRKLL